MNGAKVMYVEQALVNPQLKAPIIIFKEVLTYANILEYFSNTGNGL